MSKVSTKLTEVLNDFENYKKKFDITNENVNTFQEKILNIVKKQKEKLNSFINVNLIKE